jgi:hypothetical protein
MESQLQPAALQNVQQFPNYSASSKSPGFGRLKPGLHTFRSEAVPPKLVIVKAVHLSYLLSETSNQISGA